MSINTSRGDKNKQNLIYCTCGAKGDKKCLSESCIACCVDKTCSKHYNQTTGKRIVKSKNSVPVISIGGLSVNVVSKRKYNELISALTGFEFPDGESSKKKLKKENADPKKEIENLKKEKKMLEEKLSVSNSDVVRLTEEVSELEEKYNCVTCQICFDRIINIKWECCKKMTCGNCVVVNNLIATCYFCRKDCSVLTDLTHYDINSQ